MPTVIFAPSKTELDIKENTKILAAGIKAKVSIRFGCGACRCGTCAVRVGGNGILSEMKENEEELLKKMNLPTSGEIRLSCQTRIISGLAEVDLDFQDEYCPEG